MNLPKRVRRTPAQLLQHRPVCIPVNIQKRKQRKRIHMLQSPVQLALHGSGQRGAFFFVPGKKGVPHDGKKPDGFIMQRKQLLHWIIQQFAGNLPQRQLVLFDHHRAAVELYSEFLDAVFCFNEPFCFHLTTCPRCTFLMSPSFFESIADGKTSC